MVKVHNMLFMIRISKQKIDNIKSKDNDYVLEFYISQLIDMNMVNIGQILLNQIMITLEKAMEKDLM
jgi:hypothetical protein